MPLGEDDKEYVMVLNSGEVLENGEGVFYPTENNLVIMQFTGLLDRHGKEIYEGDIVKLYDNHPDDGIQYFIGVMTFEENLLWWIAKNGTAWRRPPTKIEVIGNIYENLELLKEDK